MSSPLFKTIIVMLSRQLLIGTLNDGHQNGYTKWIASENNYPVFKEAIDTSSLEALIDEIKKMDLSLYTDQSLEKLNNALNFAIELLKKDDLKQDEIAQTFKKLQEAKDTLVYQDADYSKIDQLIDQAQKLDSQEYLNFDTVKQAIAAVIRGKNITEQEIVDQYAKAIETAINNLQKKPTVTPHPDQPDDKSNNSQIATKTGDNSPIAIYLLLLVLSGLLIKKRKLN